LKKAILLTVIIGIFISGGAYAFSITDSADANALASAFLMPGTGITISGASINYTIAMTESVYATGIYSAGPMNIGDGIILTTGNAQDALPPDKGPATSTQLGLSGNALVDQIVGYPVYSLDTVILTINFSVDPGIHSIVFDFIFGSEEFPEYVGSPYNDSYGVFLNGSTGANQIVFDSMGNSITINGPFFSSGSVMTPPENGMGYDGSTGLLITKAPITPGSSNNQLQIVISDVGDRGYDSGVLMSRLRGSNAVVTTPGTDKATATVTPTSTITVSPTASRTSTITPTHTQSKTFTVTPTITRTRTITQTWTITKTSTRSPTFTITQTSTITATVTPTHTFSPTSTTTPTYSPTPSITPTFTVTETSTDTPTNTPTPSVTPTFTATGTRTETPTVTATATVTPTLVPFVLVLDGNYPNPFRSGTNIVYRLSRDAVVDIKVFTISGETVRHDKGIQGRAGMNSYPWDGRNSAGKAAASGTYLYKIHAKTRYNEESYFISKMARVR
jgi:hypothetical protein